MCNYAGFLLSMFSFFVIFYFFWLCFLTSAVFAILLLLQIVFLNQLYLFGLDKQFARNQFQTTAAYQKVAFAKLGHLASLLVLSDVLALSEDF